MKIFPRGLKMATKTVGIDKIHSSCSI